MKKLVGIRCSLLFFKFICFRWGSVSGLVIDLILLLFNIKFCKLIREESMLGEREEIRLFLSLRIFNFFSFFCKIRGFLFGE